MYTINALENYKNYPASTSSYLDGRYFNLIFQDYPGLIKDPLYIIINDNDIRVKSIDIHNTTMHNIGLLRVIVIAKDIRHSILVLIDYIHKKVNIYDPDVSQNLTLHQVAVDQIKNILASKIMSYEYVDVLTS